MGQNNTLSFIGIGNTDKKETNNEVASTPLNNYLLDAMLDGQHWHTTNAFKFQNFRKNSYTTITLSAADVFFNLFKNNTVNPNQYEVALLDNELTSFIPTLGVELEF